MEGHGKTRKRTEEQGTHRRRGRRDHLHPPSRQPKHRRRQQHQPHPHRRRQQHQPQPAATPSQRQHPQKRRPTDVRGLRAERGEDRRRQQRLHRAEEGQPAEAALGVPVEAAAAAVPRQPSLVQAPARTPGAELPPTPARERWRGRRQNGAPMTQGRGLGPKTRRQWCPEPAERDGRVLPLHHAHFPWR